MKKTVLILMFVTIISKLLGFARDIVLSYFYGASEISDVYLISLTIPTVLIALLGKGIAVGYIPMFTRIETDGGMEKANRYTNNITNLVLVICTIIFSIGFLFTAPIIKLFASGFEGRTLEIAIQFTRITLVGVYFSGLFNVYLGYLQMKHIFIMPALMGIPANIIAIGSIYISFHTNMYVLAAGALLAIVAQFLLLVIFGYRKNYRYQFHLDFRDEYLKKMVILALPAIIGASVSQINILVDRTLASGIAEGGITALNLANTINGIIIGVFVLSINSVLYPRVSKFAAEKNILQMKKTLFAGISSINVLVLPMAIGLMIFAEPIVRVLYGRGHFDSHAVSLTSSALIFYTVGLVGLSHREIISNIFYSLQDTKTPMRNATFAMGLNIGLNILLSRYLGIGGIALATSISTTFCTFLLIVNLRKKIGGLGMKRLMNSFLKILAASLIMGFLSKVIYDLLIYHVSLSLALILSILAGAFVYFVIIFFMRITEMEMLVLEVKGILKRLKRKEMANM